MCGLVAIWDPKGRVDPGQIDAALDHLSHRGPDGRGVALCHGGAVGLGHVRLSVIDLEGGAQPLSCDDGRIQAVVNGEFYGFEAIRSTLRARGHHFTTDSDSEVLLHLYREYGDACVDHLRGEFAFALWDGRRRRLLAARDRFGVKPLCYTVHRGRLILTSEAKALKAFSVTPTWDQSSLLHACRHQYLPPRRTLFADVSQVPPGHLLVHDGGAPRLRRYWDLDLPVTVEEMSDEAARVSVLEGLREAVRRRLRADVPVAFHLSGGLDSASTLALAAEAGYGPLHAFTVSFGVADYDELGLAETTAAHLGATLHPVHVGQGDLLEALPEAVYFSEGLAINGQLPAKLLLSRAVRDAGFKVTLSGEGADEALLGYPHLQQDALSAAEDPAHRALLNRHHRLSKGIMLPVGEGPDLPSTAARLGYVPTFLSAKAQFGARLTALLTDDAQAQIARRDPLDITPKAI